MMTRSVDEGTSIRIAERRYEATAEAIDDLLLRIGLEALLRMILHALRRAGLSVRLFIRLEDGFNPLYGLRIEDFLTHL